MVPCIQCEVVRDQMDEVADVETIGSRPWSCTSPHYETTWGTRDMGVPKPFCNTSNSRTPTSTGARHLVRISASLRKPTPEMSERQFEEKHAACNDIASTSNGRRDAPGAVLGITCANLLHAKQASRIGRVA